MGGRYGLRGDLVQGTLDMLILKATSRSASGLSAPDTATSN
jgi:hypothetical protein